MLLFIIAGMLCFAPKKELVAFRIGTEPKYIDYDLDMALKVLKGKFEQKGYRVGEFAYSGNLYPKELDDAKINIFVRGFIPFYDKRFSEDAVNVLYIHRLDNVVKQEFDNFDYYLTSQKVLYDKFKSDENLEYFGTDNISHESIVGEYDCDVLYIFEYNIRSYWEFLKYNDKNEVYSGSAFYNLSEKERRDLLKKCKVVTYSITHTGLDDSDYIPFALYDIMSYGKPVITNYNKKLAEKYNGILMYEDANDLMNVTINALKMPDRLREKMALEYKEILDKESVDISFIDKFKKKNKNIKGYLDNIN